MVEKLPGSRRYRLLPEGYRVCVLFLTLVDRIYAPLTAGLFQPISRDARLPDRRLSRLDHLYRRVAGTFDELLQAVGLKAA